jgi:hypothetical protein
MATSRKTTAIKANVSVHRQGLTIEVPDVRLAEAAQVAAGLLDALRELTQHYPELIVDNGGVHGGILGEVPDDGLTETRKRVGFLR